MGQSRDFDRAYHRHMKEMATDPLNVALNSLYNLSSSFMKAEALTSKQSEADEKFERDLRLTEVNRLTKLHPDIDPTMYGNVILSESDFYDYKNEVIKKQNMTQLGGNYKPQDGILSEEAQREMYTYGDTNFSLDDTAGIVSMQDLLNYDAWLLGDAGHGRDIARRHNHAGILNESILDPNSAYDGKYVLDQGDYNDLRDKGLIVNMTPDVSGNYILDEIQKSEIVKKYTYWREGFVGSRELPTRGKITELIMNQNKVDLEFESELRQNKKYEGIFNELESWRDLLDSTKARSIIDSNDRFTTDYLDSDGSVQRKSLDRDEFMEQYPLTYNLLTSNFNIESVAEQYLSSGETQLELQNMPIINEYVIHLLKNLHQVNLERQKQGIGLNQYDYVQDSQIMGDARNIVLDDLQSRELGNGIMLDLAQLGTLPEIERNKYIDAMISLEASYADPESIHYNPNVLTFLSLYGYDKSAPGQSMENVLNELRGR